jgi:hypothetical protein
MNRCCNVPCLILFWSIAKHVRILFWCIAKYAAVFSTLIRVAMVSKHLELMKRQAWDCYRRFASPSSTTAPPPSHQEVGSSIHHHTTPPRLHMQEVGSSSHRRTAPLPSRQEETSLDDSVEMWVVHHTAPPPPLLGTPPPARLSSSSSDMPGGGFIIRWLPLRLLRLQQWMPPRQRGELIYMNYF